MKLRSAGFAFAIAFAISLVSYRAANAQALPTATRSPIQVGAAFSFGSPDFGTAYTRGVTAFGTVGFSRRFAVEADAHFDNLVTPQGVGENTFVVGPRYSIALEGRANVYVKLLGGVGQFKYNLPVFIPSSQTYGVLAGGGGIEYRLSTHINVRAIDLELQTWPGHPPRGLTPFVASMGIAYVR
jgi:hypothetical protein